MTSWQPYGPEELPIPAQPGLYIGGLRNDLHPAKLAGLVSNLLSKFKVQVPKQWIHITFKSNDAYAIVELPDVEVSHFLLTELSTCSLDDIYDLYKITIDPATFKVGPKLTNSGRHRSRSRPRDRRDTSPDPGPGPSQNNRGGTGARGGGAWGQNTTTNTTRQHSTSPHPPPGNRRLRSRSQQQQQRGSAVDDDRGRGGERGGGRDGYRSFDDGGGGRADGFVDRGRPQQQPFFHHHLPSHDVSDTVLVAATAASSHSVDDTVGMSKQARRQAKLAKRNQSEGRASSANWRERESGSQSGEYSDFDVSAAREGRGRGGGIEGRGGGRGRYCSFDDGGGGGGSSGTSRADGHPFDFVDENHSSVPTSALIPSSSAGQKSLTASLKPGASTGPKATTTRQGKGRDSDVESNSSVPPSKEASSSSASSSAEVEAAQRQKQGLKDAAGTSTGLSTEKKTPPVAGGVQRLMREECGGSSGGGGGGVVNQVSRSMSDRGIYGTTAAAAATTNTAVAASSVGTCKTSSAATSMTGIPQPSHVSVTTSTPGTGAGMTGTFYRLGQAIGRETRHSEFKQGGRAQTRAWMLETVGKYVCGFLNSGEGGTLYIGVDDSGLAFGIDCPQSKEDDYRLVIDDALKSIDPPIFPDSYNVRFIPLMEHNGHISDSLQVLEVEVGAQSQGRLQLYVFRGNAFLRRDGSLQGPLKARQVQEWMRKEVERTSSSNTLRSQLKEVTSQLQQERQQASSLQERVQELENRLSQMKESKKHSDQSPSSSTSDSQ